MRLTHGVVPLLGAFCLSGLALAADPSTPTLEVGRYVSDGDWGTLQIKRVGKTTTFEIDAMGGNCHVCSLSGVVQANVGVVQDESVTNPAEQCKVSFKTTDGGWLVEPQTNEACRNYCGMRATFEGVYNVAPTQCLPKQQQSTRNQFLALYKAKQFAQARDMLAGLLSQCSRFINWIAIDQIRNDLALAQYHAGDSNACLQTLAATRAGLEKESEFWLPPCDHDNYIATAKATWHNQKLCGKPGP